MLEGENNPVLESADDVTANHTVTFLPPEEPGTASLRCDYEAPDETKTEGPTDEESPTDEEEESPTEDESPTDGDSGPTPNGETETPSDEETGETEAASYTGVEETGETGELLPSEPLTIEWQEE
jgi:hypothetical protein